MVSHRLAPLLRVKALVLPSALLGLCLWGVASEDPAPIILREASMVGLQAESEGFVVVSYNGSWGWVCQPDSMPQVVADVVCGQLGFVGGQMWASRRLSSVRKPVAVEKIWLHPISCVGTESGLSQCQHHGWGVGDSCLGLLGVTCLSSLTSTATPSTSSTSTWVTSTPSATMTPTLSATESSATTEQIVIITGTISLTANAALAKQVELAARVLLAEAFGALSGQITTAWESSQEVGTSAAPTTTVSVTSTTSSLMVASTSTWTDTATRLMAGLSRRLETLLLLQNYEVRLPASQASEKLATFDPELAAKKLQVELAQLDVDANDVVFSRPLIADEEARTDTLASTTTATALPSSTLHSVTSTPHDPWPSFVDPGELVNMVRQREEELIDQLLSGNASQAEMSIAEGVISVQRVRVQEIPANGSVAVAVSNSSVEVAVPVVVFSQLGLEDAVVVVTALDAAVSAALGRGSGAPDEAPSEVMASVNLNIVSTATSEYVSVQGLAEPVRLQLHAYRILGARCAWWDEQETSWSGVGFVDGPQAQEGDPLVCYTTHFTLFGAIVEGFVSSLECSQVSVLSADAVAELVRGDWYTQAPAILLWLALALLLVLMAVACHLDRRRAREEYWSDEHFLILEDGITEARRTLTALADEDNEPKSGNDAGQVAGSSCCLARACRLAWAWALVPLQCLVWCWGLDAVKEALDDLMENFVEYFGEIRAVIRGLRQSMASDAAEGGRLLALLSSAMSAIMVRNAQLHAGAELKVAHCDVRFVMSDETTQDMLSKEVSHVDQETDELAEGKRGASDDRNRRGARSHVLRVKTHVRSSDLEIRRALKLAQLHQAVCEQVKFHLARHSFWSSLPSMTTVLFVMFSPVGNVLVPSIFATSAMRALLLMCKAVGAILIVTVFFDAAGDATSKFSNAECAELEGVGGVIGRMLAVGVGSALLAGIPVSLLSCLHSRRFKRFRREGCPEWRRQLRAWRVQDKAIWLLGAAYVIFGVLFICLFLANVEQSSLGEWLVAASFTIVQDGLLVPLIFAIFGPLFAIGALAVVSRWRHSERGQVIQDHVDASWRLARLSDGRNPDSSAPAADLEVGQGSSSAPVGGTLSADLEAPDGNEQSKEEQNSDSAPASLAAQVEGCAVAAAPAGAAETDANGREAPLQSVDQIVKAESCAAAAVPAGAAESDAKAGEVAAAPTGASQEEGEGGEVHRRHSDSGAVRSVMCL